MITTPESPESPEPPAQYRMTLTLAPHAVRHIRRIVRIQLTQWRMSELTDAAEPAVSEVLTNVIRHAPEQRCTVHIMRQAAGAGVRVEVRDGSPTRPAPREAAALDEDGRGLALLSAITDAWDAERDPGGAGKTVWFELKAHPETHPASHPLS